MNYQSIYNALIASAIVNPYQGYTERHHIIPRCLGGNDESLNIVRLSARQHFIAHLLLAKIYGGKLAIAAFRMSGKKIYGNRKYEWLRQQTAEFSRQMNKGRKQKPEWKIKQIAAQTGSKNAFYGKRHSEESRKKMSLSQAGNKHNQFGKKQSLETRIKRSKTMKGKPKSAEHRANLSKARMGYPSPMKGKKRLPEWTEKMVATRMANGSYVAWNKGLKGENHANTGQ